MADLDGDGLPDLVINYSGATDDHVVTELNKGNGVFDTAETSSDLLIPGGIAAVTVGDVDAITTAAMTWSS